jgi:hypothetical protein
MSSILMAAAAAAAAASAPPTVTADEAMARARALFASAPPRKPAPCQPSTGDEIVVCVQQEDPATQYVPSDTDNGSTDDGTPHAPDVSGLPDCSAASFCTRVGKTPRHPLIIDLKAIPEAPPGSDADKIARGEQTAP